MHRHLIWLPWLRIVNSASIELILQSRWRHGEQLLEVHACRHHGEGWRRVATRSIVVLPIVHVASVVVHARGWGLVLMVHLEVRLAVETGKGL